ncbi:hypothetical protein MPH_02117 [Macrophomina phaseolina MS6]|uniref:Cyclin-D1-binding protein 1-like N-terminal domain-containing protein n=1 Tax=Macrophomina phaseolina (strain MS6) TaxID=1126212 RepID=K2SVH1_MACPH|nr:hypothetical protein MPH_02117 [Macrophomina phaseolina MS6]
MAPASTPADLNALVDLTKSTSTLLDQFLSNLSPTPAAAASTAPTDPTINALALLKDSATLLKAHTTKLSLLLLNKPFTATAITRVLREISASVLPAMMGGAQLLQQKAAAHAVPLIVEREVRARVRRIVAAVAEEVVEVRGMADRAIDEGNGGGKAVDGREGRDTLSSTGLVWEACDALIEVQAQGVVGVVVKKVEMWRATLLDAVEELKEWGEEAEGEDEDEDGVGSDDEKDSMEEMFSGEDKLGKGNDELRAQLDAALKKVKTVTVLYQALVKRRIKTYPGGEARTEAMDQLLDILQCIPDLVDDMASAFYDLNADQAKEVFTKLCADSVRASELVKQNWEGKDDEFTAWSATFRDAINA